MQNIDQQTLPLPVKEKKRLSDKTVTTFQNNLSLPVHRWFRYSAGFSAPWVGQVIRREASLGRKKVLDPFVGSGTVLIESELAGVSSIGIESHPLISRIAEAKLCWKNDVHAFKKLAEKVLLESQQLESCGLEYPSLIQRCFTPEALKELTALRDSIKASRNQSASWKLVWFTLVSILRSCSTAGTAQWQYVLPKKHKAKVLAPRVAFAAKVDQMISDMAMLQTRGTPSPAKLIYGDARSCVGIDDGWADLIITSPPYINNYDYADATRLELMFLGEIDGWSDLQTGVREKLIPSCTQHVSAIAKQTLEMIEDPLLDPIRDELRARHDLLLEARLTHGGKKNYHAMVTAYFIEMAKMWKFLRKKVDSNGLVIFVIGDSAPYGIHIPVEEWLGKLALNAGFLDYSFEKVRDRNTKWKNRKHTVPLKEGNLIIKA